MLPYSNPESLPASLAFRRDGPYGWIVSVLPVSSAYVTTPYNLLNDVNEPFPIIQLAEIEPEHLLIEIAEQVERLHADIFRSSRVSVATEVFHAIRMDFAAHVLFRVVDDLVDKLTFQPPVGKQFVREHFGAGSNVLLISFCRVFLFRLATTWPAPDRHAPACPLLPPFRLRRVRGPFRPLAGVHVAGLAPDEGFIYFHLPRNRSVKRHRLHGKAYALKHEPRGFLSYFHIAGDFVACDPILAVDDQPRCGKPLVQADRRIFEDRSNLPGRTETSDAYRSTCNGPASQGRQPFSEPQFGHFTTPFAQRIWIMNLRQLSLS